MRKFVLAAFSLFMSAGLIIAASVTFVSFKDDKLTVKEGDKEASYKVTDKTVFKFGDKVAEDAAKAKERLGKLKEGAKFDISTDKDTVTEIKFGAPKKKTDK